MSLISDYDVVVIGAGAAGLAASAELMAKGKSVMCLEAMDRIGGHYYADHSIFGLPCDIGALASQLWREQNYSVWIKNWK